MTSIQLEFKINKQYLLVHALRQNIQPFPEWVNLKNYLWRTSSVGYSFLAGSPEVFLQITTLKSNEKILKDSLRLLKKGMNRKEFKRLYRETADYSKWLKQEWKNNKDKIFKWIQEISGISSSSIKVSVFVTHPKLCNGKMLNASTICWGHPEDWKHYSIVYLTHELLHILTDGKYKNQNLMHALIEFLADNEIRIRLNQGGKYFCEGKFRIGHKYLLPIEKKILPYWKKFLADKKMKNLFYFEKEIIKKGLV